MKFLLDTDTCIYVINERPARVLDQFRIRPVEDVGISSITVAELSFGVAKGKSARNREALAAFLLPLEVAPFDRQAALAYGEVRAGLERRGSPIGPLDLLIAAHALSIGAVLVTNNLREFKRVGGLRCENWA
ncbi:MAG: type II toxin-antitoxin system tRNA(fMet)-specific endonuclease VapC [Bradyrhizobium sp.]